MKPYWENEHGCLYCGEVNDVLGALPPNTAQTCITSPPYWGLRSYLAEDDINKGLEFGQEATPELYVERLVGIFNGVYDVLRPDGTVFLNLGDTYIGNGASRHLGYSDPKYVDGRAGVHIEPQALKHPILKPKDMAMIPHRSAIGLQAAGWWVRNDIVWEKPNSMPSSVTDRCSVSKEYIFLLSRSMKYYFDYAAIQEPSITREARPSGVVRNRVFEYDSKLNNNPEVYLHKNLQAKGQPVHTMHKKRAMGEEYSSPVRRKRDVWRVNTKPYKGSHFAVFPPELITPCVLAGSRVGDTILDPFMGSGTTAMVAEAYGRRWVGVELNPKYCDIAIERISGVGKQSGAGLFNF